MSGGKDHKVQIVVAIISAIATIAVAVISTRSCRVPERRLVLEIKQPVSGATVPAQIKSPADAAAYFQVSGVLSANPSQPNLGIYVLVYDGGGWWIQDAAPAKAGAWNIEAWIGGKDNKPKPGQTSKLRAVLANRDSVEEFKKTGRPVSEDASELGPGALLSINTPSITIGALAQK